MRVAFCHPDLGLGGESQLSLHTIQLLFLVQPHLIVQLHLTLGVPQVLNAWLLTPLQSLLKLAIR